MNKLWENLFYRKFAKFINSIEIPRYAFSHHYQLIKLMNFSKSFCWRNSKKEEPPPPARDFFTKFIFIVYSDEIFAKIFFILLKKLCAELSSRRFNIPEINEGQRTVWLATQTHISLKLIEENLMSPRTWPLHVIAHVKSILQPHFTVLISHLNRMSSEYTCTSHMRLYFV